MPRLTRKDLEKIYRDLPTLATARAMGVEGGALTRGEAVGRYMAKRGRHDYEQAGRELLREMAETGATERRKLIETGLGKRQKAGFAFEGPGKRAGTRETVARAERAEYGLEFEKGLEPTLKRMVKQKEELTDLDIEVIEEELKGLRAVPEVKKAVAKPVAPARVAKPRRKLRPPIKKFLWEGTPTKLGLRLPGLLAPAYGYKNIADWLGHFAKKGYEYAYPRGR